MHVGNRFKREADGEENRACHFYRMPEGVLSSPELCSYRWGVEKDDRQRADPNPEKLEDPEAGKGQEFGAHVIEAVISACHEHTIKEERPESKSPCCLEDGCHEADGRDAMSLLWLKSKSQESQENKVGCATEVCDLV